MRQIVILLMILTSSIFASDFWSNSTANITKKGVFEVGVFNSLKYGLTESIELETHPLFMFVIPNITVKKMWIKDQSKLSSRHLLVSPSFFLNSVSRGGTGGILPETTVFNSFVFFDNSVFYTIGSKYKTTIYAGAVVTIGKVNEDNPTIDYLLAYQRLSAYYNRFSAYYGTSLCFDKGDFKFDVGLKMYIIPEDDGVKPLNFEQKSVISYVLNKRVLFDVGYNVAIGDMPYGMDYGIFPLVDARFKF